MSKERACESDDGENRESVYFDSTQDAANEDQESDYEDDIQRIYETAKLVGGQTSKTIRKQGSIRRFSRRMSRNLKRTSSGFVEALPETTGGWTVLLSTLLSTALGYELKLQKSLTKPPIIMGQLSKGSQIGEIYAKMTSSKNSILSRSIQPSLFVGTRGIISSTAAYLLGGPSSTEEHLRFREIVTMAQDGAKIAVDWEVPLGISSHEARKREILKGPIHQPVIIILHGINNDSSFGYMQSLQRSFANRGWNACAMNFRGCGGIKMTTPRGYNGSYTGDLRNFVHHVSSRLSENVPIFLVGNSLGANVMAKYLGEGTLTNAQCDFCKRSSQFGTVMTDSSANIRKLKEGLSGTLPPCVSGAACLGNPLKIESSLVKFPFNVAMAAGVKKYILSHWTSFHNMKDAAFQKAFKKAILSATIANLDRSVAPYLNRNDPFYPYGSRIGFKSGDSYWLDSSSYRLVRFISVPFLNLTAEDDFLVSTPNKNKLSYLVANPNVILVETRCGGHLGWQESPPSSDSAFGAKSWADAASADFFESVMKVNMERNGSPVNNGQVNVDGFDIPSLFETFSGDDLKQIVKGNAMGSLKEIQSRL